MNKYLEIIEYGLNNRYIKYNFVELYENEINELLKSNILIRNVQKRYELKHTFKVFLMKYFITNNILSDNIDKILQYWEKYYMRKAGKGRPKKLTITDELKIYELNNKHKLNYTIIAKRYNVTPNTIANIIKTHKNKNDIVNGNLEIKKGELND